MPTNPEWSCYFCRRCSNLKRACWVEWAFLNPHNSLFRKLGKTAKLLTRKLLGYLLWKATPQLVCIYFYTAWKVSVFGVLLVRTFPHLAEYSHSVSLRIQSECGKIRTRKTPNKDTFLAVLMISIGVFKALSNIEDGVFCYFKYFCNNLRLRTSEIGLEIHLSLFSSFF